MPYLGFEIFLCGLSVAGTGYSDQFYQIHISGVLSVQDAFLIIIRQGAERGMRVASVTPSFRHTHIRIADNCICICIWIDPSHFLDIWWATYFTNYQRILFWCIHIRIIWGYTFLRNDYSQPGYVSCRKADSPCTIRQALPSRWRVSASSVRSLSSPRWGRVRKWTFQQSSPPIYACSCLLP